MNFIEDVIQRYAFSKEAIIELDEDGGRTVGHYSELFARALGFSGALAEVGVGEGDTVAIAAGMRAESAIALLACLRMGAVAQFPDLDSDEGNHAPPLRDQLLATKAVALVAPTPIISSLDSPPSHCFDMDDLARIFDEDLPQATPVSAVELDPGAPAIVSAWAGLAGELQVRWRSQAWLQDESRRVADALGYADQDLVWWTTSAGAWEDALLPAWLAGAKTLLNRNSALAPVDVLRLATTVDDFETEEGTRTIVVCADEDQLELFPEVESRNLEAHLRLVSPTAAPAGTLA